MFVAYKVKTIRENGVSKQVKYDFIENVTTDELNSFDKFPFGQQLEDDGVAFYWAWDDVPA